MKAFCGKSALITGGNKGIGRAIAFKLAKEGCNVSIVGRTTKRSDNNDSSIYRACEEIKSLGVKCIPFPADISKIDQIKSAVEMTAKEFGGIDILINNAGYIKFKSMLDTPLDEIKKLHQLNSRGSFMMSKYCIPYLIENNKGGHIINISPPINLSPGVFINKIGYTITKYLESMLVIGLSEELKDDNVSVNALWPKYAIFTDSLASVAGKNSKALCRKPEIMADACAAILNKDPKLFSGKFCIDEEILKSMGVNSFDDYAYDKGNYLAGKLIKVPYNS